MCRTSIPCIKRLFSDTGLPNAIGRLGRSVLLVANALAELDAAGVALYADQQAIDSTTPMGRAMIQMASVIGEQERQSFRSRVLAGLGRVRQQGRKLGRPKVAPDGRGVIFVVIHRLGRCVGTTAEMTMAISVW